MIKLSIIIPVYNVEKYIKKCVQSCILQNNILPSDYELIIVNDGSSDSSIPIIKSMIEENSNIRLIEKDNGGLSSARNKGLEFAHGEYIWFVDSDDYIEPNSVSNIIKDINNYRSQIFFYDINCIKENNGTNIYKKMSKSKFPVTFSGDYWLRFGLNMWPMAQMYIYQRNFLLDNKLLFMEGLLHEDVEFKFRALLLANTVTYIPEFYYNYLLRNNGSISAKYSKKRKDDLLFILELEDNLLRNICNNIKQRNASFALYRNMENYINFLATNKVPYKELQLDILFNKLCIWLKKAFLIAPIKEKIKISIIYINPKLLYIWYVHRSK